MNKELDRVSKHQNLIQGLYSHCKKDLGFDDDVTIIIMNSKSNSENPLGKTAFYEPSSHKVGLYTKGRHIKDILRSLAHELVHHAQNCRGEFAGGLPTVEGYAQKDDHLREMEREAYEKGNMLFRDWEDGLKSEETLFTEKSTGEKLMEDAEKNIRSVVRKLIAEMLDNETKEVETESSVTENDQKFFPSGYEINHKAYRRLNENLMQRWGFTKKEK